MNCSGLFGLKNMENVVLKPGKVNFLTFITSFFDETSAYRGFYHIFFPRSDR